MVGSMLRYRSAANKFEKYIQQTSELARSASPAKARPSNVAAAAEKDLASEQAQFPGVQFPGKQP